MAWPKGKPRKGYVRKDGKPHAGYGERIVTIKTEPPKYKQVAKPEAEKPDYVVKGITGQAVVEPCPKCGFAYADGGYCSECGWTRYDPTCPHCRKV